jgi:hypothetical protein
MDKYDDLVNRCVEASPPEHQSDIRAIVGVAADLARTVDQIGLDLDRIATALERLADKFCG